MRRFHSVLGAAALGMSIGHARADDIAVPADLQATLLAKVVPYDRNLSERAGDRVRTLLVGKPSDPTSMPFIRQMQQALKDLPNFGGMPHEEQVVEFAGAAPLLEKCRAERISVVYLGPGLQADIDAIRSSLEPLSILTVTASPEGVLRGAVLGFDLVQGRPKLLVHLAQARKQRVHFVAEVLKLARIVDDPEGRAGMRLTVMPVLASISGSRFEPFE
jgi:hypothetical protein